jgi:hypothetical protein
LDGAIKKIPDSGIHRGDLDCLFDQLRFGEGDRSFAMLFTVVKVVLVCAVGYCAFFFGRGDWLHYALSGGRRVRAVPASRHEAAWK